ncbi:secreted RxLR effector protein 161-like [Benincasa hispida]|uniref:secreted RxLR effector protein 161-like n=1 Tax=Benincasa hispida TaxID=102211 RepID=UPI0018FFD845|nr:secreted RxLR effector protein 161-like [Benincasa hispida]
MKDLGSGKKILGITIDRDRDVGTMRLSQEAYCHKMLKIFRMNESKSVTTPLVSHFKLSLEHAPQTDDERDQMQVVPYANVVGNLMYLMVCTISDLAHCLSVVSRYMADPESYHWQAVEWILRYIKGTVSYGLLYTKHLSNQEVLISFVDADYATDKYKRRSLSSLVFKFFGNTVSWKSSLQSVVTLSTTEVEYMALTEAFKEVIWLNELAEEFHIFLKDDFVIFCDSQSAVFCQRIRPTMKKPSI